MSYSALAAVATAIAAALDVPTVLALAPGGVYSHIPQTTTFPCLRFGVAADAQRYSGLGTAPGAGQLSEIDLRVHLYSAYEGVTELHALLELVVQQLRLPLTVVGHGSWASFYDRATPIDGGDVIGGERVSELVAFFRLYVEQQ